MALYYRKKDIRAYLSESNHSCNNFLCQSELGTCISVLSIILEAGTASIINILMLTQSKHVAVRDLRDVALIIAIATSILTIYKSLDTVTVCNTHS